MGPGTHVIQRIIDGMKPTSYTDSIAQQHDIDFLTQKEPILSDLTAIMKTDNSFQSFIMRLGLGARSVADYLIHVNPYVPNITHINKRTDTMDLTDEELVQFLNGKLAINK